MNIDSLMVLLNAYLQMEKKKVYSLMELFKELKRTVLKPLNLLMVKKISSSLMEPESENIQMAELESNTQMEHMRHHIDND